MLIQILIAGSGFIFGVKNKKFRQKLRSIYNKNKGLALKPKPSSLYLKGKTDLLTLKKGIKAATSGDEMRHQQLKRMDARNGGNLLDASEITLNKILNDLSV